MSSIPTITTQPQSQVVNINSSATFTVVATSTLTITYQWYFNCVAIGGATNSSLTINPVTSSNGGVYYVVVTNSAGSTQSANAVLIVNSSPLIIEQPESKTVDVYSSTFLNVIAFSQLPLTYQWYFNSQAIPCANQPNYLIASAQESNEGTYYVIVTNSVGSTQSSNATLTVKGSAPIITKQPKSKCVEKNESVKICVEVSKSKCKSKSKSKSKSNQNTFQWYQNKKLLKNENSSKLCIKKFSKDDVGKYYVIVTNENGSTQSDNAKLSIKKKKKSKKNSSS
jgi:hypothetical protein